MDLVVRLELGPELGPLLMEIVQPHTTPQQGG